MNAAVSIIGVSLSLLLSIIAVTISITQMKSNISALVREQEKLERSDSEAVKQLTDLLVLVKAFISEQTVINKTVARALDDIIRRIESTEELSRDTSSTVQLLTEFVKQIHPTLGGN